MAKTHVPTRRALESPMGRDLRSFDPSIFIRARSVLGSRPTTSASKAFPFASFTFISSAFSITWLLVTIYPSRAMIKPDPRLCCLKSPSEPPLGKGLKKSSKGFLWPKGLPKKCRNTGPPPSILFTVRILTTPGRAFSARSLKFSGIICTAVSFDAAAS